MKNPCRIDARKSDAEIMEKGAGIDPNRELKCSQMLKNACQQMILKFDKSNKRKPAMGDAFGRIPWGGFGTNILIDLY